MQRRFRSSNARSILTLVLGLTILAFAAPPAHATWGGGNGRKVMRFSSCSDPDTVLVRSDNSGGAYVLWLDSRNGQRDLVLTRITSAGVTASGWPKNAPVVVNSDTLGLSSQPDLAVDAAGNAYVCWIRGGTYGWLWLQKITNTGTVASGWPVGGVLVKSAGWQRWPHVIVAGDGHPYVGWNDGNTSGGWGVYVQSLSASDGSRQWSSEGLHLTFAGGWDSDFSIAPQGASGCLVAVGNEYLYRVDASGNSSTVGESYGVHPNLAKDGTHGYHLVGEAYQTIKYHRLDTDGVPTGPWATITTGTWDGLGPTAVPDGSGGCLVGWMNETSNADFAPYVHHVKDDGTLDPCWPTGGRQVCPTFRLADPIPASFDADGAGGVVVGYSLSSSVCAGQVRPDGSLYPAYGTPLYLSNENNGWPAIIRSATNTIIGAWADDRAVTSIYANQQALSPLAEVGSAVSGLHVEATGPHSIKVNWTGLDDDPTYGAALYYDVRWATSPNDFLGATPVGKTSNIGGGETHCATAIQLQPCTSYYLLVRAVYECGRVSPVASVQGTTACSGLDVMCVDGGASARPVDAPDDALPLVFALGAVRPNPSRAGCTVEYAVPASMDGAPVDASLFDVSGRRVRVLAEGTAQPGRHVLSIGREAGLRAGVYFLRLRVGAEERRSSVLLLD